MMLTRVVTIVVVAVSLAPCASAQASPYLTTSRAHAAVQRYAAKQAGTATWCERVARTRVDCGVSIPLKISSGPASGTATAIIQAFLRKGEGPYLERIGEWAYTVTLPVP